MITEGIIAPTLSVSIVLHDSDLEQLKRTLDSLITSVTQLDRSASSPVTLTLLDNCSSAAYRAALAAMLPDVMSSAEPALAVRLQLNEANAGFGGGHNEALNVAFLDDSRASYLLVLNPDVELAPDALRSGVDYLEAHPEVAALNPRCRRSDGSQEYLCKRYPKVFDLLLRGLPFACLKHRFAVRLARYEYRELGNETPSVVRLLSGACMLCRGRNFDAVAGFDTGYFMYFEDFDLSERLASTGQLVYLPAMQIVHHGGFAATKGLRHIRWFGQSALRFFSRYGWQWR